MREYNFVSGYITNGFMPIFGHDIIRKEPMVFGANKKFAFDNGGEITKMFVTQYLTDADDWIIDSRVHMLMPGWYPCIPGWHHDDIPRYTDNKQPNYDNPEYTAMHRMVFLGNIAPTQFVQGFVAMPKIREGIVYNEWNKLINAEVPANKIKTPRSGEVISFNHESFHRGTQAKDSGWRFFIRASRCTFRQFYNEIRVNAQVYLPEPEIGW